MRATFKNTTALIAALSLSMPTVAPAQGKPDECQGNALPVTAAMADAADLFLSDELRAALDGGDAPGGLKVTMLGDDPALCLKPKDLEALGASEEQIAMLTVAQPDAAGGSAEAEAETAEADPEPEAPAAETEQAEAEPEQPATETEEAEAAEADPEPETEQAATEETEEPATEAETAEAEEPATEAETAEAGEPASEAETAEAEAEPQPETTETAEQDATEEAPVEVTETAPEAESAETGPTETAEAETSGASATETAPEETTAEVADTDAAVQEALAAAAAAIEEQAVEEADAEAQAEIAEADAPEEAAAASAEDAEVAEVEEIVVTEETARSSTEEFESRMDTTAGATTSRDKEGLSDFEKALIVGLGAIVIGKALGDKSDTQVVSKSQDRVVVLEDGRYRVIRDDNELIERPGSNVRRERFNDGSTRTTVTREDGVQIVTIRDAQLRVLRRVRIDTDGTRTVLIDDTADIEPVDVAELPDPVTFQEITAAEDAQALRKALERENRANRRFALYQIRNIERVRKLAPAIALDAINFRSGSAVIDAEEVRELTELATLIGDYIAENPGEIFLIEGHTDAVGNAAMNLALSDRRAESVALALTEFFGIPPENLVVQGYGETDLKVKTLEDERANRRAAVRRITPLIAGSS